MAVTRFAIATGNWIDDATWSTTSGGSADIPAGTYPGSVAGDTAIFDANSGNITVTQGALANPLAELDQENYTGTLIVAVGFTTAIAKLGGTYEGGNSILCTGDITLFTESADNWVAHSGNIRATQTSGTPNLLRGFIGDKFISNFRIDNSGVTSFIQMAQWTLNAKTFFMVAGKFDTGDNDMNVASDIIASAGEFRMGVGTLTLTANGDVENAFGNDFNEFAVASGVTATIETGKDIWTAKLSGAGNVTSEGTGEIVLAGGPAGFWAITGDVTANLRISGTSNAPGADICLLGDRQLNFDTSGILTLTMDANIDIGNGLLLIRGTGNDDIMTVDFASFNIVVGQFKVGRDAALTGSAVIDFGSGTHTIASLDIGNAANTANAIDFATCNINLSGTFDGNADGVNPILATNTDAAIHGGTIEQLTITDNLLNAVNGVTDGTGNTLVAFEGNDNFPPAGSLLLLGAGT